MMARELCRQKAVYHVHGKDSRITPHIRGLDCYEQGICNGPGSYPYMELRCSRLRPRCSVVEDLLRNPGRGDYHGPVSIEVEDPLMPNNLVAIQKSAVISE